MVVLVLDARFSKKLEVSEPAKRDFVLAETQGEDGMRLDKRKAFSIEDDCPNKSILTSFSKKN